MLLLLPRLQPAGVRSVPKVLLVDARLDDAAATANTEACSKGSARAQEGSSMSWEVLATEMQCSR
jgi:hypothetical protein